MFDFDATLPLMAIQFLLLTWVMNLVFYKPLTTALTDREDYIRMNKTSARERLEKAKSLTHQYEQELAQTRRQSQDIIAAAQAEAQKAAIAQVAEAQQRAQAEMIKAKQALDQEKQAAFNELEKDVNTLSRQILDKLLGAELVG